MTVISWLDKAYISLRSNEYDYHSTYDRLKGNDSLNEIKVKSLKLQSLSNSYMTKANQIVSDFASTLKKYYKQN